MNTAAVMQALEEIAPYMPLIAVLTGFCALMLWLIIESPRQGIPHLDEDDEAAIKALVDSVGDGRLSAAFGRVAVRVRGKGDHLHVSYGVVLIERCGAGRLFPGATCDGLVPPRRIRRTSNTIVRRISVDVARIQEAIKP